MRITSRTEGKYIAVCGSTEERHGIVLAKNQLAKKCGVKTGDVIWEAKQKCPQLTIVPPHMDQYVKFSKLVRSIYLRYSPDVEAFGIDESWIEMTGSPLLKDRTPAEIANELRETDEGRNGAYSIDWGEFQQNICKTRLGICGNRMPSQ